MANKIVPKVPKKSGNTRQISPAKHWVFTLNNYTKCDIETICGESSIKRYSFQEEEGDNGTPHLQGYLEFITKRRPLGVFKGLGAHWEKCKRIKEAIAYTQKSDTRAGQLFLKGVKKLRPLVILSKCQLYKWQKDIVDLSQEIPDDRIIHWYWEPNGCKGKTQLCRYLVHHHDALLIDGAKGDMFYQVANCKEAPEIIIMNLTHGSSLPNLYALEAIKDGLFASPKYESKMFIMNSPHIFVFANFEIYFKSDDNYNHCSRWKVVNLDDVSSQEKPPDGEPL